MVDFAEDFSTYALSKLPTFRDNFNYSTQALGDASWVPNLPANQRVDPVNENIFWTMIRNGTDNRITFDLGTSVSETNWVLRCHLHVNSGGVLGSPQGNYSIALQDTDVAQLSINDSIGWGLLNSSSGRQYILREVVNGVNGDQDLAPVGAYTSPDDLFLEMTRISENEARMRIYSDANFSILQDEQTITVGGVTNLRFLILSCSDDGAGFAGTETGTVDNIEFWNGGQQGDITFQDDFIQKPVTFSDDFSGTDDWTDTGTGFGVNTTTDVIDWDAINNNTVKGTEIDLGTPLSDDGFVWRFKVIIANRGATSVISSQLFMLLSDTSGVNDSTPTQDYIGLRFVTSNTLALIEPSFGDGIIITDTPTAFTLNHALTTETLFVEVKRTSGNLLTISLFNDSNFSNIIEVFPVTIPSTIIGLQHIKFLAFDSTGGTNVLDGTIDNIEIYNGDSTLTRWLGATGNDVGLDTVDERINFDPPTGVDRDELIAFDLQTILDGSNADDSNWTLRFKINTDTLVQGTSEQSASLLVGLDNNLDSVSSLTHNLILFRTSIDQGGAGPQFGAISSSLSRLGGGYFSGTGTATQFPIAWSTGTRYVEVKRLSPTEMQVTLFTDASFTDIETNSSGVPLIVQDTIDSGIIDLRYIRVTTESSAVANDTSYDGSIDDIEFYNGVSVPRTPVEEVKDFEDNFFADNWVDNGTLVQVNTATQVIDVDSTKDGTLHQTAFDLGVGNVSDTEWTLRFDCRILSSTVPTTNDMNILVNLSNSNQTVGVLGAQDTISFEYNSQGGTGVKRFLLRWADGVGILPGTGNNFFVTSGAPDVGDGKFYVEVKRISSTQAIINVYTDADFSNLLSTSGITVIPATITGLRFIRVSSRDDVTSAGTLTSVIDNVQFWNKQSALDHENKWRVLDL